jgi:LDH2 family malate/lactate/ureidoglycolate dehydrogenase
MVVARNSNHFGTAAFWTQKMARAGCIGIALCNGCAAVPPWQGKSPRLATNPLSMAVPGTGIGRWVLDMATTTVANGKLVDAAYHNQDTIPAWWGFLDSDGNPTTDRRAAEKGRQTPIGGYKGTGLAMMVEILCSGLSGGLMATDVPAFNPAGPLGISHMFLAIDPARFMGLADFQGRMSRLATLVKSSEPAKGYDEVLIAGEPEWRAMEERTRDGIPIPEPLWERLGAVAAPLKVALPPPSA